MIRGSVHKGLGDTSRQLPDYDAITERVLGYIPYPGSLNVWLDRPVKLGETNLIVDSRWGKYKFWPAKINGVDCHIVRPPLGRNRPRDAEIVAPIGLREHFNLRDGNKVEVEVL